MPPVCDNCVQILSSKDKIKARDLYWTVMAEQVWEAAKIIETLKQCVKYNPWAFEPHVLLAQKYLHANDSENTKQVAGRALEVQLQWRTAWDKRLLFGAWVAWTRVMYQRAEDELEWPTNSMNVINFGLQNISIIVSCNHSFANCITTYTLNIQRSQLRKIVVQKSVQMKKYNKLNLCWILASFEPRTLLCFVFAIMEK